MVDPMNRRGTDMSARYVTLPEFNALPNSAAGSAVMAGPTATLAVSFPAGRFTVPPIVTGSLTTGANAILGLHIHNVTTAGFTAYIYAVESTGIPSSWTAGAVSLLWRAEEAH